MNYWETQRDAARQHKLSQIKDLMLLANTTSDDKIRRVAIIAAENIRNSDRYLQVHGLDVFEEEGTFPDRKDPSREWTGTRRWDLDKMEADAMEGKYSPKGGPAMDLYTPYTSPGYDDAMKEGGLEQWKQNHLPQRGVIFEFAEVDNISIDI